MDNIVNNSKKPVITQEHKILFRNTFYSYLNNYGSYIFSLVTSFILARLISQELWGYLIIALSYTTIIGIIISFLPPGLEFSLRYYLTRYNALGEKYKAKRIIRHAITQKLLIIVPAFIISIIFFIYFSSIFEINLKDHINLMYILFPLIFINGLTGVLNSINQAFNRFKLNFLFLVIRYIINIGGLIFILIFFNSVKIEHIAYIDLFSFLIPFIVKFIFILITIKQIKTSKDKKISFKETFSKTFRYGINVSSGTLVNQIWNETTLQSIGIFESTQWVTGFSISRNYIAVPRFSFTATTAPLTVSFSRLYSTEDYESIKKIFILSLHYNVFVLSLITGILYFASDFFLSFVYGESYLLFSLLIKIMLVSTIFAIIGAQFESLIHASNRVNLIPKLILIWKGIEIPLYFIGLIFFGIIGAIIGLLLASVFSLIIRIILCFKLFKIKLDKIRLLKQYLIFFISIGTIIFLNYIILDKINLIIFQGLNLNIFKELKIIAIPIYVIILLLFSILFRVFSKRDIEYLEEIFKKENKIFRLVKRSLNFFKKYLK